MKKKLNFALVGCSGFIAKKHVMAIKELNHNFRRNNFGLEINRWRRL